jgi:UDP-N-acetylglucosamine 2-epimerase
MNQTQAVQLVRDTFESAFAKPGFVKFIKNLLTQYEEAEITRTGNLIPDAFKDYVSKFERVGKYTDSDDKRIDILVVWLRRETSIERARSMQKFCGHYLQGRPASVAKMRR